MSNSSRDTPQLPSKSNSLKVAVLLQTGARVGRAEGFAVGRDGAGVGGQRHCAHAETQPRASFCSAANVHPMSALAAHSPRVASSEVQVEVPHVGARVGVSEGAAVSGVGAGVGGQLHWAHAETQPWASFCSGTNVHSSSGLALHSLSFARSDVHVEVPHDGALVGPFVVGVLEGAAVSGVGTGVGGQLHWAHADTQPWTSFCSGANVHPISAFAAHSFCFALSDVHVEVPQLGALVGALEGRFDGAVGAGVSGQVHCAHAETQPVWASCLSGTNVHPMSALAAHSFCRAFSDVHDEAPHVGAFVAGASVVSCCEPPPVATGGEGDGAGVVGVSAGAHTEFGTNVPQ